MCGSSVYAACQCFACITCEFATKWQKAYSWSCVSWHTVPAHTMFWCTVVSCMLCCVICCAVSFVVLMCVCCFAVSFAVLCCLLCWCVFVAVLCNLLCCVMCLLLMLVERVCVCVCVVAESVFSVHGIFLHRDPGKRTVLNLAVQGLTMQLLCRLSSVVTSAENRRPVIVFNNHFI